MYQMFVSDLKNFYNRTECINHSTTGRGIPPVKVAKNSTKKKNFRRKNFSAKKNKVLEYKCEHPLRDERDNF